MEEFNGSSQNEPLLKNLLLLENVRLIDALANPLLYTHQKPIQAKLFDSLLQKVA